MSEHLSMWTIYVNPLDAPGKIVVRRWEIRDGRPHACEATPYDDLDSARAPLIRAGLTRLERDPLDDPCVVETWL